MQSPLAGPGRWQQVLVVDDHSDSDSNLLSKAFQKWK